MQRKIELLKKGVESVQGMITCSNLALEKCNTFETDAVIEVLKAAACKCDQIMQRLDELVSQEAGEK